MINAEADATKTRDHGMADEFKLKSPWLVAVWPGMGNVAISAGYYLMAKLSMHILAEFPAQELFEVENVEVKNGLIHTGRLPRSRFFVGNDPKSKHDLIVFIGEAQPARGRYAFCHRLIEFAKTLGVERVYTFAAMATQMHPAGPSRVYCAATDTEILGELRQLDLEALEDGHIGGLNGVLLGVAAESGLRGACLLGEMPHVFAQLPFPKASLAVLKAFGTIAQIQIDFTELIEQATNMEQKLGELLAQMQRAIEQQMPVEEEESIEQAPVEQEGPSPKDRSRIEELFEQAQHDRTSAYELKRELDRLGVFQEYEDRFLDLFKKPE
jgi:proteasome assembly chaperone (PAC2) family protein